MEEPATPAPETARPGAVTLAVRLLWISIVAGIPLSLQGMHAAAAEGDTGPLLAFNAFIYAVSVMVVVNLGRGRNWARTLLLAFNVLNGFAFLAGVGEMRKLPTGDFLLLVLVAALDLAALYLVYSRAGAAWFRPVRLGR